MLEVCSAIIKQLFFFLNWNLTESYFLNRTHTTFQSLLHTTHKGHTAVTWTRAEGDGRLQAVHISEAPQEPHPRRARRLPPQHLVPPCYRQLIFRSRRPARGRLERRGPAVRTVSPKPHSSQRSRALSHSATAPHFVSVRGPLPKCGIPERRSDPPSLQPQRFSSQLQGPPSGQQTLLPK